MNHYHDLAYEKNELRRAKDHEAIIRAIVESQTLTTGKTADDRKRELALALANHDGYRKALDELRKAEHAVDEAQAAIDAAEAERRDREWAIRARLAEALGRFNLDNEDQIPDWLQDRRAQHRAVGLVQAHREMDDLFTK